MFPLFKLNADSDISQKQKEFAQVIKSKLDECIELENFPNIFEYAATINGSQQTLGNLLQELRHTTVSNNAATTTAVIVDDTAERLSELQSLTEQAKRLITQDLNLINTEQLLNDLESIFHLTSEYHSESLNDSLDILNTIRKIHEKTNLTEEEQQNLNRLIEICRDLYNHNVSILPHILREKLQEIENLNAQARRHSVVQEQNAFANAITHEFLGNVENLREQHQEEYSPLVEHVNPEEAATLDIIVRAICANNLDELQSLRITPELINIQFELSFNSIKFTLLQIAIMLNRTDFVRYLVNEKQADLKQVFNYQDQQFNLLAFAAIFNCSQEMVSLLLEYHIDPNAPINSTATAEEQDSSPYISKVTWHLFALLGRADVINLLTKDYYAQVDWQTAIRSSEAGSQQNFTISDILTNPTNSTVKTFYQSCVRDSTNNAESETLLKQIETALRAHNAVQAFLEMYDHATRTNQKNLKARFTEIFSKALAKLCSSEEDVTTVLNIAQPYITLYARNIDILRLGTSVLSNTLIVSYITIRGLLCTSADENQTEIVALIKEAINSESEHAIRYLFG